MATPIKSLNLECPYCGEKFDWANDIINTDEIVEDVNKLQDWQPCLCITCGEVGLLLREKVRKFDEKLLSIENKRNLEIIRQAMLKERKKQTKKGEYNGRK